MNAKRMIESVAKLSQGWAVVAAFVVSLPIVVHAERPEIQGSVRLDQNLACEGDLDGDGQVGPVDLAILLGSYGYCRNCEEDLDGDHRIDDRDLDILAGNWGECEVESRAEAESVRQATVSVRRNEIEAEYRDTIVKRPEAPEGSTSCPADLDQDGEVGPADLAILLGGYGYCRNCAEDLDGDRRVDEADVDVLIGDWGACPAAGTEIKNFCRSDFNADGDVGSADLSALLGSYGRSNSKVDLDGDDYVDDADVDILLADWGPCP